MAKQDKYVTVPISILAWPGKDSDRLQCILNYGIDYYASNVIRKQQEAGERYTQGERFIDDRLSRVENPPADFPDDLDPSEGDYIDAAGLVIAASDLGFRIHNLEHFQAWRDAVQAFVDEQETLFGVSPKCRVRIDAISDALSGRWEFRDLAVLMAALSFLGGGPPKVIRRAAIQVRALGYKKDADVPKTRERYSDKAVRVSLDRLEARKFVWRWQTDRRTTIFSLEARTTQEQPMKRQPTALDRRKANNQEFLARKSEAKKQAKAQAELHRMPKNRPSARTIAAMPDLGGLFATAEQTDAEREAKKAADLAAVKAKYGKE